MYWFADAAGRGVGVEVVVALRQERASLRHGHDERRRISGVHAGRRAERSAGVHRREPADLPGERRRGVDGIDAIELLADRLRPERLHAVLVHHARVEVTDLLLRPAPAVEPFDQPAHVVLGAIGELGEGAVGHAVRGDVGAGEPSAVHEAVEIVLRADGAVEGVGIQPRLHRRLAGRDRAGAGDRQERQQ